MPPKKKAKKLTSPDAEAPAGGAVTAEDDLGDASDESSSDDEGGGGAAVSGTGTGADDLPMHWKSAVDKVRGRTYYFHEVTRQTQWDRPTSSKRTSAQCDGVAGTNGEEEGQIDREDSDEKHKNQQAPAAFLAYLKECEDMPPDTRSILELVRDADEEGVVSFTVRDHIWVSNKAEMEEWMENLQRDAEDVGDGFAGEDDGCCSFSVGPEVLDTDTYSEAVAKCLATRGLDLVKDGWFVDGAFLQPSDVLGDLF